MMQLVTIWIREAEGGTVLSFILAANRTAARWGVSTARSSPLVCLITCHGEKKKSPSFCVYLEQGGDEGTSSSEKMRRKIIIRARVIRIKSSASTAPCTAASCTRLCVCREQIESAQVLNAARECLYMQNKSGVLPSPRSTLLAGWCWHCLGCCSNKRHAATTKNKKRKERGEKKTICNHGEKNK